MEITRIGSQPSGQGPQDWFTGSVRIDPLFQPNTARRAAAASVTFEPGARTAWHTHPLGQTLIITSGIGWVQKEGGSVEEVRPGDIVWFEPNEKHWHGATAWNGMTHIAIQENLDGKVVDWMEKVSDGDYGQKKIKSLHRGKIWTDRDAWTKLTIHSKINAEKLSSIQWLFGKNKFEGIISPSA